ncbi:MAG: ATP synthase subunit B family protein, partial [Chloroflexota bacterium]
MLHLIERLEALVAEGTRIPLTGRAVVDEREFMDIIDQLRVSLPEELRQARRITQERDRLLSEGKAEAERTRQMAEEQAAFLLQDTELSKSAERRAQVIVADAQQKAQDLLDSAQANAEAMTDQAERQAEEVR